MSTPAMVPMLSPDGTPGDIPQAKMQDAIKAGFKQAVVMTSSDGKSGYIPVDRQHDALKAGFKLNAPPAKPESGMLEPHHDWTDPLRGAAHGIVQLATHPFDALSQVPSISATPTPTIYGAPQAQQQASDAQNKTVADNAATIQQQVEAAKDHPAFMAGEVAGPALLTHGIAKLAPKIPGAIGKAALLGKTPAEAYESALKPSTTLPQGIRDNIVQTGLDKAIPISKGGVEKLSDLLDDYNQKIAGVIAQDPYRPIDPNAVATRADQARAKFRNQVNAGGDLSDIDTAKKQFLSEQGARPGSPAPPMDAVDAQAMKQGTYETLKGKYGEQGRASVEAQKALARGLKEEIANQFPEIRSLNANESRLLDLQPILERAVNRISNHQSIGIGTPIAGAAAKAVSGSASVGVVAGVLKAVLDNPSMKSRLAIAVSKSSKIPIGQAIAKVQAYSTSLVSAAAGAQAYSSDDNPNQPTPQQP